MITIFVSIVLSLVVTGVASFFIGAAWFFLVPIALIIAEAILTSLMISDQQIAQALMKKAEGVLTEEEKAIFLTNPSIFLPWIRYRTSVGIFESGAAIGWIIFIAAVFTVASLLLHQWIPGIICIGALCYAVFSPVGDAFPNVRRNSKRIFQKMAKSSLNEISARSEEELYTTH